MSKILKELRLDFEFLDFRHLQMSEIQLKRVRISDTPLCMKTELFGNLIVFECLKSMLVLISNRLYTFQY